MIRHSTHLTPSVVHIVRPGSTANDDTESKQTEQHRLHVDSPFRWDLPTDTRLSPFYMVYSVKVAVKVKGLTSFSDESS